MPDNDVLAEALTLLEDHYQRAARVVPKDDIAFVTVMDRLAAIEQAFHDLGVTARRPLFEQWKDGR